MLELVPFPLSIEIVADALAVQQIVHLNHKSAKYGLALSQQDALELLETRKDSLCALGRVEVGSATVGKLIDAFCDSAYINQQDYVSTLNELLEIFYYFKNESMELISDDELIELMKYYFEHRCRGSLEMLKYREMEKLARNLRHGVATYTDIDDYEEEEKDDEEE